MECDEHGNIWLTGPGGVWVITQDGEHLGTVPVPEVVGSLCWGGDDMHTLFLTSTSTVRAITTRVAPARLPPW
jgi:gluconolactonase